MNPISHVISVSLAVPNINEATAFYRDLWQLDLVDRDGACSYFGAACAEDHILRLRQDETHRVDKVTFAVNTRADVDAITERVGRAEGGRVVDEPAERQDRGGGYASRFFDVDGRLVELAADMALRPFHELHPGDSCPRQISHIVFNTPDIHQTRRWYEQVLSFKVSDWVKDFFCFLRTGSTHHILAFAQRQP